MYLLGKRYIVALQDYVWSEYITSHVCFRLYKNVK